MKKNINIRNLIIVMLCITIIFMGIGFAFLAVKLEEESNRREEFNVVITKIEPATAVKGGIAAPIATKEIVNEGKTANFKFTLNSPNDEIAYNITIKNTGTLPARIIKLLGAPDYLNDENASSSISPVTIKHNKIDGETLNPNKELTIKLIATYNMSNSAVQKTVPYQMTILATNKN